MTGRYQVMPPTQDKWMAYEEINKVVMKCFEKNMSIREAATYLDRRGVRGPNGVVIGENYIQNLLDDEGIPIEEEDDEEEENPQYTSGDKFLEELDQLEIRKTRPMQQTGQGGDASQPIQPPPETFQQLPPDQQFFQHPPPQVPNVIYPKHYNPEYDHIREDVERRRKKRRGGRDRSRRGRRGQRYRDDFYEDEDEDEYEEFYDDEYDDEDDFDESPRRRRPRPRGRGMDVLEIPPPKTNLDRFVELLEQAREEGNKGLMKIAVDGIYQNMQGGGQAGGLDPDMKNIMNTLLARAFPESPPPSPPTSSKPFQNVEDVLDLMGKFQRTLGGGGGEGGEKPSENIEMANIISGTVRDVMGEARDIVYDVTGTGGGRRRTQQQHQVAMSRCPSCHGVIPYDSKICGYCGMRFGGGPSPAQQQQPPPQPPPAALPAPQSPQDEALAAMQQAPPAVSLNPQFTPQEIDQLDGHLHKLCNYIQNDDDPTVKSKMIWGLCDEEEKKSLLFAGVMGRDRLYRIARMLADHFPNFGSYWGILQEPHAREWVHDALETFKLCSMEEGFRPPKEEYAKMLATVSQKLGVEVKEV